VIRLVAVALVAFVAPVRAETITIEAGASYLAFDLPANASTPALAIALGAGTFVRRDRHISLRGHIAIGDGYTTSLGLQCRRELGTFFVGYELAIASVVGPNVPDRAHGLGLTAGLRLGATFGPLALAAHARPTWVFASDSHQTPIDGALELGATLGLRR